MQVHGYPVAFGTRGDLRSTGVNRVGFSLIDIDSVGGEGAGSAESQIDAETVTSDVFDATEITEGLMRRPIFCTNRILADSLCPAM